MDATADSFYGSQGIAILASSPTVTLTLCLTQFFVGRITDDFDDYNGTLLDELVELHPSLATLEMETYHLYYFPLHSLHFIS